MFFDWKNDDINIDGWPVTNRRNIFATKKSKSYLG
jgi:hypothetical protein